MNAVTTNAREAPIDRVTRDVLIEARIAAHLPQKELAGRLRRSTSFISARERGTMRVHRRDFMGIAWALESEPAQLFARITARSQKAGD